LQVWLIRSKVYALLPVVAQNALVAWRGRRIFRQRFGPASKELDRLLEISERADPEERRAHQDERVHELVRHAYENVPHYRAVMDERRLKPSDIRGVDDLPKLPVMRKEDVRRAGKRLLARGARRRIVRPASTAASTGTPLTVWWDRSVILINHACYMRVRRWAGLRFGQRYATMQGRLCVPPKQTKPPYWRWNPAWNQLLFSTIHLSESTADLYLAKIREFDPEVLEAYPSCAYALARFLEARGETLPLRGIITTGEPLVPEERQVIEGRFETRVFDAYGQAERVVFSSECEEHDGHHLHEEYGVTEIVDDDGNRLPPGSPGLLVGTSLHNMVMPLIRYACGDIATRSDRACACGRTLPMLQGLTCRAGDYLVTPDGRLLPSMMVSWAVKRLPHVHEWQIQQHSPDEIVVLAVTDEPIGERDCERVRRYMRRRVGPTVKVRVERVESIPRTALGKLRHAVSSVPLPWGELNRSRETGGMWASDDGTPKDSRPDS
jgi:phenylacetate-CoA ligase